MLSPANGPSWQTLAMSCERPLPSCGPNSSSATRPGRTLEELSEALASAEVEVARLSHLAEDLLVLARSDESQLDLHREDVRIAELLGASAALASKKAAARGVRLTVEASEGLTASVDPRRLRQAIDNVIDNAVRNAPDDSEVTVRARASEADLVIDVSDSGPGFPEEYLGHAFERFKRPDGGRSRDEGGSGLGLAITKAITTAHHGHASVANRPDGGAVVTLDLPGAVVGPPGPG